MVAAVNRHSPQVILSPEKTNDREDKAQKKAELCKKIKFVALAILVAVIGAVLFVANPTFFAIGFIAGVIWNKKIQEAINKVLLIWKKQTWGIVLVTGIGAAIALPVTLAASALLFGGAIGAYLSKTAQEQDKKDKRVLQAPSATAASAA